MDSARHPFPGSRPAYPPGDNGILLRLQDEYLAGDSSALSGMYGLACKVCRKYINAKSEGNSHIAALTREEREEKAHNAAAYLVSRYLEDKGFRIRKSFTGYLYLRVLHELYYRRKVDGAVDFVDPDILPVFRDRGNGGKEGESVQYDNGGRLIRDLVNALYIALTDNVCEMCRHEGTERTGETCWKCAFHNDRGNFFEPAEESGNEGQ